MDISQDKHWDSLKRKLLHVDIVIQHSCLWNTLPFTSGRFSKGWNDMPGVDPACLHYNSSVGYSTSKVPILSNKSILLHWHSTSPSGNCASFSLLWSFLPLMCKAGRKMHLKTKNLRICPRKVTVAWKVRLG